MKKSLLLLSVFSLSVIGMNAQMGHSPLTFTVQQGNTQKSIPAISPATAEEQDAKTNSSERLINSNPSLQFSTDVTIKVDTVNQRHIKVATAFNGWIYSACSINRMGFGGIEIRRSKDGGLTWYDFATGTYSGVDYPAVDIAVAGNDTNNLFVFLAGVYHDLSGGIYNAWIDKYNGATGAWISEAFNETNSTLPIRDIAIATDSHHPAWISTPFSVGVVYSKASPYDSVIYNASVDGGTTYINRQGVYATGGFCDKVAIAFGIGATWSNGRYFVAFESKASAFANEGHVLFSHTTTDPSSTFQTPIYLDSILTAASFNNRMGHPRIACTNDGMDNDSGNITTVVFVDRNFNGADHDVLPLYSNLSVYSSIQNWHGDYYMANSGNYETGGDVAFNEISRTFCGTYFDSTTHFMVADSIQNTLSSSTSWTYINLQYNDLTNNVIQPFPRVSVNLVTGTPNFAWNSEGPNGKGISLFDAMTPIPLGIPVANSPVDFVSSYPNPTLGNVNFNFTLRETNHVQLSIVNLLGENVLKTTDLGILPAGEQNIRTDLSSLSNGVYIYRMIIGSQVVTGNIIVAHQ